MIFCDSSDLENEKKISRSKTSIFFENGSNLKKKKKGLYLKCPQIFAGLVGLPSFFGRVLFLVNEKMVGLI